MAGSLWLGWFDCIGIKLRHNLNLHIKLSRHFYHIRIDCRPPNLASSSFSHVLFIVCFLFVCFYRCQTRAQNKCVKMLTYRVKQLQNYYIMYDTYLTNGELYISFVERELIFIISTNNSLECVLPMLSYQEKKNGQYSTEVSVS